MKAMKWVPDRVLIVFLLLLLSLYVTSSHQNTDQKTVSSEIHVTKRVQTNDHDAKVFYKHTWPRMKFGWKIMVGSIIGFLGSAFGTVGGVGGGGIFVPMLTLIVGFDAKSATAISKCMITGGAAATVFYNLKQRHPTLDMPVIDYDLALLFQPMLMLGISIGVAFNVIFPDWLVTALLIVVFIGLSVNAFLKGVQTWKKETILKKEARQNVRLIGTSNADHPQTESHINTNQTRKKVSVIENVCWKELGILVSVWIFILALQIGKNYTTNCSAPYWVLNLLQVPVTVGTSFYEAVLLQKGKRVIASMGEEQRRLHVWKLMVYCTCGLIAGIIGGLLGLGGGFILGPLFIGLGIPPQLGLECYVHFCHDVFCIHVCGGILPSQTLPCSLCTLLCSSSHCCCTGRAAFGEKGDCYTGKNVSDNFHPCTHCFCEWNITRQVHFCTISLDSFFLFRTAVPYQYFINYTNEEWA
ncbi:sulfite exporter TauE/SafE family protein 3 isoform X2 [Vigna angularis]|uniref:sulfite exporter TauE/SafE family protein 3 isoform X2 n=1 Tax=Phaseolus angularis TaxID=3914 RepID=UPI0022B3F036|nr:sulfite exporter TauE/SafE family protein 3 isoform X2 [Vigna angularis]